MAIHAGQMEAPPTDHMTPSDLDRDPVSVLKQARAEWSQRSDHLHKDADALEEQARRARQRANEAAGVCEALGVVWERFADAPKEMPQESVRGGIDPRHTWTG